LQQNLAWLASSYYRDLGLFVRTGSESFTDLVDKLFKHDFDLAVLSWPLSPDPDQRHYWHSTENTVGLGLNFTSYDNPALDRLLDQAVAIPGCDAAKRTKIYEEIQEILAVERPVDFLLAPNRHVLVGAKLHGLNPGPFAPLTWNVSEWYLQQEGEE
jgi:ABC-type transport system substrate-binding protein